MFWWQISSQNKSWDTGTHHIIQVIQFKVFRADPLPSHYRLVSKLCRLYHQQHPHYSVQLLCSPALELSAPSHLKHWLLLIFRSRLKPNCFRTLFLSLLICLLLPAVFNCFLFIGCLIGQCPWVPRKVLINRIYYRLSSLLFVDRSIPGADPCCIWVTRQPYMCIWGVWCIARGYLSSAVVRRCPGTSPLLPVLSALGLQPTLHHFSARYYNRLAPNSVPHQRSLFNPFTVGFPLFITSSLSIKQRPETPETT